MAQKSGDGLEMVACECSLYKDEKKMSACKTTLDFAHFPKLKAFLRGTKIHDRAEII